MRLGKAFRVADGKFCGSMARRISVTREGASGIPQGTPPPPALRSGGGTPA